jgi:hypothetical protein
MPNSGILECSSNLIEKLPPSERAPYLAVLSHRFWGIDAAIRRVGCAGQAGFKLRLSIQLFRLMDHPVMALSPQGFRAYERHPSDQTSVPIGDISS